MYCALPLTQWVLRYLSGIADGDDIDLRWKTIGHKMREAGYATHWYGKGHTGYKSWRHLPQQLGFDDFVGFLGGAQDHFSAERWGLLSVLISVLNFHARPVDILVLIFQRVRL